MRREEKKICSLIHMQSTSTCEVQLSPDYWDSLAELLSLLVFECRAVHTGNRCTWIWHSLPFFISLVYLCSVFPTFRPGLLHPYTHPQLIHCNRIQYQTQHHSFTLYQSLLTGSALFRTVSLLSVLDLFLYCAPAFLSGFLPLGL